MLSETVLEWTKQWKEDGLAEGLQHGRLEQQRLMAQRLFARQMGLAEVADLTGLSVEELDALRRG